MKKQKITLTHPQAKHVRNLAKKGLFDGIHNGQDLVEKIIPNLNKLGIKGGTDQGDVLEIIYEALARAIFGLSEVYSKGNIPSELIKEFKICVDGSDDNGIDLIVKDKDGEYWAVQVKLLSQDNLPKTEMNSTFTEAHAFGKRVLFVTNCKTVDARGKVAQPYSSFKRQDFEELTEEEIKVIIDCVENDHSEPLAVKEYEYRKWQDEEAVPSCVEGLLERGRHTLIAPTGVGKTAVSDKIGRELSQEIAKQRGKNCGMTIVLVLPKITDGQQMTRRFAPLYPNYGILVVNSGSDVKVDNTEEERFLDGKVSATTDKKDIAKFAKNHSGKNILYITTYDSFPLLVGQKIDYAIFDEADLIAGPYEKSWQWGLYDENIQIDYRLFPTATWKPVGRLDESNPGVSMHDEGLFGKRTILTDHEAEKRGLIAHVDLHYPVFTDTEIKVDPGSEKVNVDGVDVQPYRVACIQATIMHFEEHPNHKKMLVRFNRQANAESFVSNSRNGLGYHTNGWGLWYIHSGMLPNERARVLKEFEEFDGIGVLASCGILDRCYDYVSLDTYLVGDPIHNASIGLQFNGRVTRLDSEKKINGKQINPIGIIPILQYEGQGETLNEAVKRTQFESLKNTLCSRLDKEGTLMLGAVLYGEEREEILGYIRGIIDETSSQLRRVSDKVADDIKNALAERVLEYYSPQAHADFIDTAKKIHEKYGDCNTSISPIEDVRRDTPLITDQYLYRLTKYRTLHLNGLLDEDKVKQLNQLNITWDIDKAHFIGTAELLGRIIKDYGLDENGYVRWNAAVKDGVLTRTKKAGFLGWINAQRKNCIQGETKAGVPYPLWKKKCLEENNFPFEEFDVTHKKDCLTAIEDYVKEAIKIKANPETDDRFFSNWKESFISIEDDSGKIVIPRNVKHKGKNIGAFITNVCVSKKIKDANDIESQLDKMGVFTGDVLEATFDINLAAWIKYRNEATNNGEKIVFKDDESTYSRDNGGIFRESSWASNQKKILNNGDQPPHRLKKLQEARFLDPLFNTSLFKNEARRILVDKFVEDHGHVMVSKADDDRVTYQAVQTIKKQIRDKDTSDSISEEDIAHYQSLPGWSDLGKQDGPTVNSKTKFQAKINLWAKWLEENPNEDYPSNSVKVEHDYPFKLGNKKGVFNLGKFATTNRRRLNGKAKEFKPLQDWEIAILDETLGKKWRMTDEEVRKNKFKLKIKKEVSPRQTRYTIYLGEGVHKTTNTEAKAEKALEYFQKCFDDGWEGSLEDLRDSIQLNEFGQGRPSKAKGKK